MSEIKCFFEGEIEKGKSYKGVKYTGSKKKGNIKIKCRANTEKELKFDIISEFSLFKRNTEVEITDFNYQESSCTFKIDKKTYKDSSFLVKEHTLKVIYNDQNKSKFFAITHKNSKLIIERTISGNYYKVVVDINTKNSQSPSITT